MTEVFWVPRNHYYYTDGLQDFWIISYEFEKGLWKLYFFISDGPNWAKKDDWFRDFNKWHELAYS